MGTPRQTSEDKIAVPLRDDGSIANAFEALAQVAAALPKDDSFWNALVASEAFGIAAHRVALRISQRLGRSDLHLVDDIAQSICLRTLRAPCDPKRLDWSKNVSGLFYTTLKRLGLDSLKGTSGLRARERTWTAVDESDDDPLASLIDEAGEAEINRLELQLAVRRAMRHLDAQKHLAVRLYYFDHQSIEQVATRLGCTAGHASRILATARRQLADLLKEIGDGEY